MRGSRNTEEMVTFELRGRPMSLSRRKVEGFLRTPAPVLCVDLARRTAYLGGVLLDLRTMDIPFRILTAVARDHGVLVGAHRLFAEVWGRPLRSRSDLGALRFNVWNLRRTLRQLVPGQEVLTTQGNGYRVKHEILVSFIHPPAAPRQVAGDSAILELARTEGTIDNRKMVSRLGCSRSAAGRILARLESAGLIERVGAGRTTAYRAREHGAGS